MEKTTWQDRVIEAVKKSNLDITQDKNGFTEVEEVIAFQMCLSCGFSLYEIIKKHRKYTEMVRTVIEREPALRRFIELKQKGVV